MPVCCKCSQNVKKAALTCINCGKVFHYSCAVRVKSIKVINDDEVECCSASRSDEAPPSLDEKFDKFQEQFSDFVNQMNLSMAQCINKFTEVAERILSLETQLKDYGERIEILEARVSDIEKSTSANTKQPAALETELLTELNERQIRSRNVLLFNLPESESEDIEDRKNDDAKSAYEVLSKLGKDCKILRNFRLGVKKDRQIRPLKLVLESSDEALSILKCRNVYQGPVKIKGDLTMKQRNHLQLLTKELQQRTDKGEKDLTIRYINNIPQIVAKKKN